MIVTRDLFHQRVENFFDSLMAMAPANAAEFNKAKTRSVETNGRNLSSTPGSRIDFPPSHQYDNVAMETHIIGCATLKIALIRARLLNISTTAWATPTETTVIQCGATKIEARIGRK